MRTGIQGTEYHGRPYGKYHHRGEFTPVVLCIYKY